MEDPHFPLFLILERIFYYANPANLMFCPLYSLSNIDHSYKWQVIHHLKTKLRDISRSTWWVILQKCLLNVNYVIKDSRGNRAWSCTWWSTKEKKSFIAWIAFSRFCINTIYLGTSMQEHVYKFSVCCRLWLLLEIQWKFLGQSIISWFKSII